ncbi:MAG: N-acetyl-gamma-glutamyl-phosphate reductase [Bacteroidota bacterium]
MIKVAVIGAAGYTGGELIRLLIHHPKISNIQLISRSQQGNRVDSIHQDLIGEYEGYFQEKIETKPDVIFLCMGHGQSKVWLGEQELEEETLLIDLSRDYRLDNDFIYGLSEWKKESLINHKKIANPGCFASAIQLALLPIIAAKGVKSDVQINAITGSTGAGHAKVDTTHFSWRNQNISVYKPFIHQHLEEIKYQVKQLDESFDKELVFIPMRGNFSKGIFCTLCFKTELNQKQLNDLYWNHYKNDAFVHIVDRAPHLKQVLNTNKTLIHIHKEGDYVLITSILDNLLKGASGQAIQNMNIHFRWPEETGLKLKAMVY